MYDDMSLKELRKSIKKEKEVIEKLKKDDNDGVAKVDGVNVNIWLCENHIESRKKEIKRRDKKNLNNWF